MNIPENGQYDHLKIFNQLMQILICIPGDFIIIVNSLEGI